MTTVSERALARTLPLTAALLLATAITGPAVAQETGSVTPAASGTGKEEVIVTSQRRRENVQRVPIAVSAFSSDQLAKQKIDGGPNLVLTVPNVKFSKGNFTGYNFAIRGIGSQLVAGSGDAGVGIHLNNSPLVANNLFEAEFYDVERVEVLRGPQGTLYGRNATGGVINVITNKAKLGEFYGNARAEYGSYNGYKIRGMVNVPLGETFAFRAAGAWLKRDGYGTNFVTGNDADNRDLFGVRASLAFAPSENFRVDFVWDHFKEDDRRSRIGKQLCVKDPGPAAAVGGQALSANPAIALAQRGFFSQGCLTTPADAANIFGTINTQATLGGLFGLLGGFQTGDALAGKMQVGDVYDIESAFDPIYQVRTDIYQLNVEWAISPTMKLYSLTSFTDLNLFTRQDYSRYTPSSNFNAVPNPVNLVTTPAVFGGFGVAPGVYNAIYAGLFPGGNVADPQNGTTNRFLTTDISSAFTKQWSSELRLQSNFEGPFNFSIGGIWIDLKATGNYYVMFNTGTAWYQVTNTLLAGGANCTNAPGCVYIDPNANPVGNGRNYFNSFGPYHLKSFAFFGEGEYAFNEDLKVIFGLRYTNDKKEVQNFPVLLGTNQAQAAAFGVVNNSQGNPVLGQVEYKELTGRAVLNWNLRNRLGGDESNFYASFSRGYKAGGLNPPCSAAPGIFCTNPTFEPEFINAFEMGLKNVFAEGKFLLNATAFYYDYKGYQVSKIVNRNSTNENIDAKIMGLEFESVWQPIDGLRFNANIGLLDSEITGGQSIDVFNRTQGNPALTVVKSSAASNCVIPTATAAQFLAASNLTSNPFLLLGACTANVTFNPAAVNPVIPGTAAVAVGSSNGIPALGIAPYLISDGVQVALQGNRLPNVPDFTLSFGAQYTWNLSDTWSLTLRADYSYQGSTYARIYNSAADKLKSWSNVNITATLASTDGWTIDAYVKNATDEKAITGTYLTDDSSGLFRNAFYTEPRTIGLGIAKAF